MKTKIYFSILAAIIVLACTVHAQQSSVVGPDSTVVIPSTVVQTNYIEGTVAEWDQPLLKVHGDGYFPEASGQPAYVVKDTTMTFKITGKTKFYGGKKRDLRTGTPVTVTFLGSYGRGPKEAASVRVSGKEGVSADSDETETTQVAGLVFNNFNDETVRNKPRRTTVFTVNKPAVITSIRNYHWNDGSGATAGEIWLVDQGGHRYGPWRAAGEHRTPIGLFLPGSGSRPALTLFTTQTPQRGRRTPARREWA